MITTEAIITVVFLSVCFAAFYAYYNKKILGDFIRKLVEAKAFSKEEALTLSKLGYDKKMAFLVLLGTGKNASIRRFVAVAEDENEKKAGEDGAFVRKEKKKEQSFFVLPEKKEDALKRYDSRGMSLRALVVCIVIAFSATVAALFAAPYISYFLSDVYGSTDADYEINDTIGDEEKEPEEENASDEVQDENQNEAQETEQDNGSRFETA